MPGVVAQYVRYLAIEDKQSRKAIDNILDRFLLSQLVRRDVYQKQGPIRELGIDYEEAHALALEAAEEQKDVVITELRLAYPDASFSTLLSIYRANKARDSARARTV